MAAQEKNIPFYQVSTSNMLSDYILCIYKGFNVLTALGYDGIIKKNACDFPSSSLVSCALD